MGVNVMYRYLIWHKSGSCTSVPNTEVHTKGSSWHFNIDAPDKNRTHEPHLNGCCPGDWNERWYDTDNEDDVKMILAMMNL